MSISFTIKATSEHKQMREQMTKVITGRKMVKRLCIHSTTRFLVFKGLGSRRGEIGPAIEMHTDLKYVYMVYFIEKNRNFICLVLKL